MPAGVSAYTALANVTLGSSAASVTFSSISQSYRDLVLVMNGAISTTANIYWKANGDTASNYSYIQTLGISVGPNSNFENNVTTALAGSSYTETSLNITQWMDYSASDKHKVSIGRANSMTSEVGMTASRWANTAAITSLAVTPSAGTFNSGCTFALYGVSA
jgi:hypothetical protein